jgi:hypothetical protein
MRWAVRVALTGRRHLHTQFKPESSRVTDHFPELVLDLRIILKLIMYKLGLRAWIGFKQLRVTYIGKLLQAW